MNATKYKYYRIDANRAMDIKTLEVYSILESNVDREVLLRSLNSDDYVIDSLDSINNTGFSKKTKLLDLLYGIANCKN